MSTFAPLHPRHGRRSPCAACGALKPAWARDRASRRVVCSATCMLWMSRRRVPSQPARVPHRLLVQLAARAYDAGRAEVRRLDPWLAQARFKDRPESVQRGFLVTVQQIVDWARRHVIAQVISPQRRSAAAGRRRVPGTISISGGSQPPLTQDLQLS